MLFFGKIHVDIHLFVVDGCFRSQIVSVLTIPIIQLTVSQFYFRLGARKAKLITTSVTMEPQITISPMEYM